ncbi:MAG: biotin--[acetyl-CoA-carboxylase] ligase [Pyrinomonadaceae bacterium]
MNLAPKIFFYESLPSTNTEAIRLAVRGAAEGVTVVADEQTAGRGRMQRSWSSPKGAGLYFTILLRPTISLERWPLLTFMAAVAVNDALKETCALETRIKWPNDILAGERKICGILAEATDTPQGRAAVVGIGINLTSEAFPGELAHTATSVAEASGRNPRRNHLLDVLIEAIDRWYAVLQNEGGPDMLIQQWMQRSDYAYGKHVRVNSEGQVVEGITAGLESDGALRVESEDGLINVVRAGDVVNVHRSTN